MQRWLSSITHRTLKATSVDHSRGTELGMEFLDIHKNLKVSMLLHSFGRGFAMLLSSSCLYMRHQHRAEADSQAGLC